MYLLVEFTDEENVAVIPDNWLDGTSCAVWPDRLKGPGKINKAVLEKVPPEDSWPAYPIRELYRNASFIEVRKKLRKAEETSDLLTTADDTDEEDSSRKSKRKKRALVYSDEDDENQVTVQPRQNETCDKLQYASCSRDESSDDGEICDDKRLPKKPKAPVPPRGNFGKKSPQVGKRPASDDLPIIQPEAARQNTQNSMIARDARLFTCLEKIIRGQEEIKLRLGQVSAAVTNLTATNCSAAVGQEFTKPDDLDLPILNLEMLEDAELVLDRKEAFQGLVNYLTLLGGRNVGDGTRRALSTVLSNDMATKYNWYGLKGKLAFGKLKVCAAVQKAVLKSCKCYASEFEKECREWLRTASDRDGGRKKRKKAALMVVDNTDDN